MKLRVLHIGKYYYPFKGGIETFLQGVVENKQYQKYIESHVLVHHDICNVPTGSEIINGVKITKVRKQGTLLYAPICASFLKHLERLIAEFKPDVIHIHMPNLSAFACLFSKQARQVPWVVHWHSDVLGSASETFIKVAYQGYRIFERALLNRAAKVIATSPCYLECSSSLQMVKDKTLVVPLGIEISEVQKRNTYDGSNKQLSVLVVGRLTYYKGHQLLLKAINNVSNINIRIVGKGELYNKLCESVAELSLQDQVTFLGHVSDEQLNFEFSQADLLCLPSIEKTEAFGMVILEAAKYSKPSLVTSVKGSGMSWVVQNFETGFVVKENDVDSLKECLLYALNNKNELINLGMAARARLEKKFSLDAVSNELIKVYELLASD